MYSFIFSTSIIPKRGLNKSIIMGYFENTKPFNSGKRTFRFRHTSKWKSSPSRVIVLTVLSFVRFWVTIQHCVELVLCRSNLALQNSSSKIHYFFPCSSGYSKEQFFATNLSFVSASREMKRNEVPLSLRHTFTRISPIWAMIY